MKALVIAPQPFFSPRGTPLSVYYRTLVTTEIGVSVDLLTYGAGQDVDIPGVRIIRIPRFAILGNVKVGPSLLKLFLDIFIALWTVVLLLRNHYDFVHAHEEAIFICRFLKPIFGFKLVYDMHSSLPQQLTNFRFTRSKTLIRLFEKLEISSLKASNAIITICPDLADYVQRQMPDCNTHLLIENSLLDEVKVRSSSPRANRNDRRTSHPSTAPSLPSTEKLIVYAGTLEPYQGIGLLLQAFTQVVARYDDAFLLIVGGTSPQVTEYSLKAERLGLRSHCQFTGRLSQHLARDYCRIASVLVSPRIEGTNTPLKVYEQLASGLPLVATNIYSHTQVLNGDVAFLVNPEPGDMARGILEALTCHEKRIGVVTNAKRLYNEKYSRTVYVNKMKDLLRLVT